MNKLNMSQLNDPAEIFNYMLTLLIDPDLWTTDEWLRTKKKEAWGYKNTHFCKGAPAGKRIEIGVRQRGQARDFFLFISYICFPINFFFLCVCVFLFNFVLLYAQKNPLGTKSRCANRNRRGGI